MAKAYTTLSLSSSLVRIVLVLWKTGVYLIEVGYLTTRNVHLLGSGLFGYPMVDIESYLAYGVLLKFTRSQLWLVLFEARIPIKYDKDQEGFSSTVSLGRQECYCINSKEQHQYVFLVPAVFTPSCGSRYQQLA
ncbi:hypothetical protein O0I10_009989 [Lichtheimia ornata]|uniref:Uncharacterized protein n=1 Tax=Lichtheimia ornata TaxID=688661 RepID=A0AAD7UVI0_9FUNG|nr:uncharacterized protein O0I10_009989 [Lichtheimia ornata]KAJ8654294.1 hypothetical protein O0I10_009989 [Lichtheimia ornata]